MTAKRRAMEYGDSRMAESVWRIADYPGAKVVVYGN